MAKIYNLTDRLTNEKPQIEIDEDHIYTVDNSKNTALKIKQLSEDKDTDDVNKMDKMIELALGKDALDYINSLDLSMKEYSTVANAVMAAIAEMELEDVEKEAAKQAKSFRG